MIKKRMNNFFKTESEKKRHFLGPRSLDINTKLAISANLRRPLRKFFGSLSIA